MAVDLSNLTATDLSLGVAGTFSVSALLSLFLQAIKSFVPSLDGRWALSTLYALSLLIAWYGAYIVGTDWQAVPTYAALLVMTLTIGEIAKGVYKTQFGHDIIVKMAQKIGVLPDDDIDPDFDDAALDVAHDSLTDPLPHAPTPPYTSYGWANGVNVYAPQRPVMSGDPEAWPAGLSADEASQRARTIGTAGVSISTRKPTTGADYGFGDNS
jgi:hypothetical protein